MRCKPQDRWESLLQSTSSSNPSPGRPFGTLEATLRETNGTAIKAFRHGPIEYDNLGG